MIEILIREYNPKADSGRGAFEEKWITLKRLIELAVEDYEQEGEKKR